MFQLTKEEFEKMESSLIFQNGTSSWGGTRKLPYAFHRTRACHALRSAEQRHRHRSQHRHHACLRSRPPTDNHFSRQLPRQPGTEVQTFKAYIEEVFTDLNDINEDTRIQLELINRTLAEMQSSKRQSDKPRNKIGF